MSNCSNLFHDFNKDLKITKTKNINLMKSKDNIRKKIKKWFKENHPDYNPKFYIQGSRKLGTLIRTKDDTCDLDDGAYFEREVGVTGTTLQKWIYEAVKDITDADVVHKAKCIRVIYSGDYHIDIPVYYFLEDSEHPLLAVKDSELEESDPKDFVEWFNELKCDQLIRIIKYLKAWGDHLRNKMPSGLAFTVLVEKNYVADDRDDISFYKTLRAIKTDLEISFECIMPTTPFDDLFSDYDQDRIDRFFERLDSLIEDARIAIEDEENQLKASKKWKKHLGKRFPEGLDENVDEKLEELLKAASLIASGKAGVNKHGHIRCKEPNDVPVKKHRFYGNKMKLLPPNLIMHYKEQKSAVEESFPFIQCRISSKGLICDGIFTLPKSSTEYEIQVRYNASKRPKVYILNPEIKYDSDIHMYKDSSLCLFYPPDNSWGKNSKLFDTIIPWTVEWLINYEIFKLKGEWVGPYKEH